MPNTHIFKGMRDFKFSVSSLKIASSRRKSTEPSFRFQMCFFIFGMQTDCVDRVASTNTQIYKICNGVHKYIGSETVGMK